MPEAPASGDKEPQSQPAAVPTGTPSATTPGDAASEAQSQPQIDETASQPAETHQDPSGGDHDHPVVINAADAASAMDDDDAQKANETGPLDGKSDGEDNKASSDTQNGNGDASVRDDGDLVDSDFGHADGQPDQPDLDDSDNSEDAADEKIVLVSPDQQMQLHAQVADDDDEGDWEDEKPSKLVPSRVTVADLEAIGDPFNPDETLAERIGALADIVHPKYRDAISAVTTGVSSVVLRTASISSKSFWVLSTSMLLLGVPWALAYSEDQQLMEMEKEERMRMMGTEVLTEGAAPSLDAIVGGQEVKATA